VEPFIEKYQYSYVCRISASADGIKSKMLPPQIGNQLGRLPFQNGHINHLLRKIGAIGCSENNGQLRMLSSKITP
jgi:hypothetical protein